MIYHVNILLIQNCESWCVVTHSIKFVHLFVSAQMIPLSDGHTQRKYIKQKTALAAATTWIPKKKRFDTFGFGWRINLAFCFHTYYTLLNLFDCLLLLWAQSSCGVLFSCLFGIASWFVLVCNVYVYTRLISTNGVNSTIIRLGHFIFLSRSFHFLFILYFFTL